MLLVIEQEASGSLTASVLDNYSTYEIFFVCYITVKQTAASRTLSL